MHKECEENKNKSKQDKSKDQHTSELNNSFKARPKQLSHLAMQFHLQVNTIKTTHNYKFITQEKYQIHKIQSNHHNITKS